MNKIILYIDTMNRGGAQRVMVNLATYLASVGIRTLLVTDFPHDGESPQYDVPGQIERHYLSDSLTNNVISKNIIRVNTLRRLVKKEKPDVVLSFLGRPNITMLLATIGLNVRKVVSVRNDPNREYGNSKFNRKIIGRFFQNSDGVVFQTNEAASYFPQTVQDKSTVILNPIDKKFYEVDRSNTTHNIISVGRFEKQKNHRLLIKAFSVIARNIPDDKLLLFGDGPLRGELEEYVDKLKLKDRVVFKGNVSNVEEELSKASLFVLSSDWEGLPNALMEAMAVGVPVISTDCPCGGPRILIRNENEGFLVPCGDVNAMSSAMIKIMNDKNLQGQLFRNGKKRAWDFYPDKIFEQWREFLFY